MTQATTWSVPLIGPASPSAYAQRANDSFDALLSLHRGTARPAYAVAGTLWVKTIDATEEELYWYDGTEDIYICQFDLVNHLFNPQSFPSGTKMLFVQTAAPVGWTKQTTHNDKALRVVSGTAGSGGTSAFSTIMANRDTSDYAAAGTIGGTSLTIAHLPAHYHDTVSSEATSSALTTSNKVSYRGTIYGGEHNYTLAGSSSEPTLGQSETVGGNEAHSHSFTGTDHHHTLDMRVQYVDVIIAEKD